MMDSTVFCLAPLWNIETARPQQDDSCRQTALQFHKSNSFSSLGGRNSSCPNWSKIFQLLKMLIKTSNSQILELYASQLRSLQLFVLYGEEEQGFSDTPKRLNISNLCAQKLLCAFSCWYSRPLWICAHIIGPSLLPYLLTITCPPPTVTTLYGHDLERDRSSGTWKKYGQKGASLEEHFWYQKQREVSRAMTAQDTIH